MVSSQMRYCFTTLPLQGYLCQSNTTMARYLSWSKCQTWGSRRGVLWVTCETKIQDAKEFHLVSRQPSSKQSSLVLVHPRITTSESLDSILCWWYLISKSEFTAKRLKGTCKLTRNSFEIGMSWSFRCRKSHLSLIIVQQRLQLLVNNDHNRTA